MLYLKLFFIDTEHIEGNQVYIIFIVTCKKVRHYFKIAIGIESSNFASEVIRSKEGKTTFSSKYFFILRNAEILNEKDHSVIIKNVWKYCFINNQ